MLNTMCDRSYRDIIWWTPFDASVFRIFLFVSFTRSLFLYPSLVRSALLLRTKTISFLCIAGVRCKSACGLWCMWHFIYASINAQMNRHIAHHLNGSFHRQNVCALRNLNASINWIIFQMIVSLLTILERKKIDPILSQSLSSIQFASFAIFLYVVVVFSRNSSEINRVIIVFCCLRFFLLTLIT